MKLRLFLATIGTLGSIGTISTLGLVTSSSVFAQSVIKGDASKGAEIAGKVCSACHGPDGNSPLPVNPKLAGQHIEYIYKQLGDFKGRGATPRINPIMSGMAGPLSDDDMKNVAAYYSSQKSNPHPARDPVLVKEGGLIYRGGNAAKNVPACASCHGPAGAGIPAQFPRIGAQHPEYLAEQLKAFRSGERKNDANGVMHTIAAKLTDREIAAVSEFTAGLR